MRRLSLVLRFALLSLAVIVVLGVVFTESSATRDRDPEPPLGARRARCSSRGSASSPS